MIDGNCALELTTTEEGPQKAQAGTMAPCLVCETMTAGRYGAESMAYPVCMKCGPAGRIKEVLNDEQMEYGWRYGLSR